MSNITNANNTAIIETLTSQPNDLFTSLKIANIGDFVNIVRNELSSKKLTEENIRLAGFTILKELIINKICNKIKTITTSSDLEKLEDRMNYFEKEFLNNFVSDLPLATDTNPIVTSGYTLFYKKLFKLQNTKIRELLEKTSPTNQCKTIIGDQTNHDRCYLCGCNFDKAISKSGKKRKTISYNSLECEHILPIFPAITHIMIYQSRFVHESIKDFLKIEYAWSHQCCNQVKTDIDFTLYNAKTNKYEINNIAINKFKITLQNKSRYSNTYDCEIIKNNWCGNNSSFPIENNVLLTDKINNILEKININYEELKSLTSNEYVNEYYILLMRYKMISAFTQNTMDEILFFGNEQLQPALKILKQNIKNYNKQIADITNETSDKINKLKKLNSSEQNDFKLLSGFSRETNKLLQEEKKVNRLLSLGESGIKEERKIRDNKIIELQLDQMEKIGEIEKEKNKAKEEIIKLQGNYDAVDDNDDYNDDDDENTMKKGEGKKKKQTKRKAGKLKRSGSRRIDNSLYNKSSKKIYNKSSYINKNTIGKKNHTKITKQRDHENTNLSDKPVFNIDYNKFILSLLSNNDYQPSLVEIRNIIKNKFIY
tara:strand:- start:3721 stop:5514 length:1794 start_codon:yes stop_codon:yes gene_type:complete